MSRQNYFINTQVGLTPGLTRFLFGTPGRPTDYMLLILYRPTLVRNANFADKSPRRHQKHINSSRSSAPRPQSVDGTAPACPLALSYLPTTNIPQSCPNFIVTMDFKETVTRVVAYRLHQKMSWNRLIWRGWQATDL